MWLRTVLRKWEHRWARGRSRRMHRPAFAADVSLDALRAAAVGGVPTPADAKRDPTGAGHAMALALRGLLGDRFFVSPQQVPAMCEQLWQGRSDAKVTLAGRALAELDGVRGVYSAPGCSLIDSFAAGAVALGPGRDSLYPYRAHRFAFLPALALSVQQSQLQARRLDDVLAAWMRAAAGGDNPYAYGSNLVVVQRIVALLWGWVFLAARPARADADGLGLEWRLLQILFEDVRFLQGRLGDSVPNNHLLADRFAAFLLGSTLPELTSWSVDAADEAFGKELLAQTFDDGGSFEHSSHYHEFACEMGVAYLLLSARQRRAPAAPVRERVRAMLALQCAVTGARAQPLPLGNAIEDSLFPLDAARSWCPGALRELYRALFVPAIASAPPGDASVERAFWLLGGALAPPCPEAKSSLPSAFPRAGLFVMADAALDARLILRAGPAPDAPLAAGHAHADLLAVWLDIGGQPLLVDAGTYTYRRAAQWPAGEPDWRAYFAGPQAHNGLCVDGVDPLGRLDTDFRPRDVAARVSSTQVSSAGLTLVECTVQAAGPYTHARRLCLHVVGEYWLLLDHLPVTVAGTARWFGMQFAADTRVVDVGGRWLATPAGSARPLALCASEGLGTAQALFASLQPLGGWVSPRYGEKCGATQLRFAAPGAGGATAFLLSVAEAAQASSIKRCTIDEEGTWVVVVQTGDAEDWIIVRPAGAAAPADGAAGLSLDGRAMWLRFVAARARRLRWLQGRRLRWPERSLELDLQSAQGGETAWAE